MTQILEKDDRNIEIAAAAAKARIVNRLKTLLSTSRRPIEDYRLKRQVPATVVKSAPLAKIGGWVRELLTSRINNKK